MVSTSLLPSATTTAAVALLLLASSTAATATTTPQNKATASSLRALEDQGYQYMESLSGYQMKFGKCVRVKVPNDDDDEEGNSYFYNGHYYAQGQQFATVYLCDESNNNNNNGDGSCGTCDTSKEYVTDLATYLETTLEYAQTMCTSCEALCYNRRRLEEEEAGEEEEAEEAAAYMNVNCDQCRSTCQNMNFLNQGQDANGDGVEDETQFLDCQQAFQDENGNVIYAGPQCDGDGDITIGFYYDEDCTIKSSSQNMDFGFEYGTFHGIQDMCLDCDPYGTGQDDVCLGLYQDSTHCSSAGKNLNGNDEELPVCKTVAKAHKEHFYGKHKKNWRIIESLVGVVLIGGLCFAFLALSYTYFLRHRRSSSNGEAVVNSKEPLADHDYHTAPEVTVTKATVA